MTTKEKIIKSALFLFNQFGFINVRLQHIADEAELSVGNLAYHFKTKDEIVEHIYEEIVKAQQNLLTDLRTMPLFVSLDNQLENTFKLQQQYRFFFTDTLEIVRSYPIIRRKHRTHLEWQTIQFRLFLELNVARGAIKILQPPDTLSAFAKRHILLTESWIGFEVLNGKKNAELLVSEFKDSIWGSLACHFTQSGQNEYNQMKTLPFDSFS